MRNLFESLEHIHSRNIIHRDLKPENLIFGNAEDLNSLKVSDFGLSTKYGGNKQYMRCGTPGFVAPEILNDEGYDNRADMFSAGIILYMILTAK